MKKLLTLTLALAVLATVSGLATAATTIKGSKSNVSYREAKVTEVNNQAKTFTVMTKGKAVVFSAAKLSKLPTVGESVDITYTQTTPGGPLEAINLNSSRSNVD
jgi:hypothetical protein